MTDQLRPIKEASDDIDYSSFARNVTSQAGEDGIIEELLARLPESDRWCVEFGAWDGSVASNSASLVDSGYSAVLIEGDRRKWEDLAARYQSNHAVEAMCAMVGWEGANTLDNLLARTQIPHDFDLLSIDIDGNDFHVWAAVEDYRPKVVVIEFNPTIANGVEFVQTADARVNQGSSVSSLAALATRKGYQLVAATEFNAFFVTNELFPRFGIRDNSVERLRTDKEWQTQIFFGYDGRAILLGGKGLYWHGVALPRQIRMVPRLFVGWPGNFGPLRRAAHAVWWAWKRLRQRSYRSR